MRNIDFLEETALFTDDGILKAVSDEWLTEMRLRGFEIKGYTIKDIRDSIEKGAV